MYNKPMYEGYERLKKYVDMIGKTKTEEEALEIVAKIILDGSHDKELQDQAMKYVNDCFEAAAIENSTYYA